MGWIVCLVLFALAAFSPRVNSSDILWGSTLIASGLFGIAGSIATMRFTIERKGYIKDE